MEEELLCIGSRDPRTALIDWKIRPLDPGELIPLSTEMTLYYKAIKIITIKHNKKFIEYKVSNKTLVVGEYYG